MARKVSATFFVTLDGVIADPHKWSFPYWNDEIAKFKDDELKRTGALLLGRKTYEVFAAAWPQRQDETGFADRFNNMTKYVVSSTMERADWSGSQIVRPTELPQLIAKLKGENGGDAMAHGSAELVQSLIRDGRLDELRLLVYPTLLGEGRKLFEGTGETSWKLASSQSFATGVVALIYERAPTITAETKSAAMKAALGGYSKKAQGPQRAGRTEH
ncbi:MAG: dihydrofolate reductase family protein [Thermoplasmata archaeon]|nr:dihydrofolate reductase family protein [Thermoplasmata archaeon]